MRPPCAPAGRCASAASLVLPCRLQGSGMWAAIRAIHRAAHLTIAVSPATAADLVGAGACDRGAVKVRRQGAGGRH